jgi:hypothetical protein
MLCYWQHSEFITWKLAFFVQRIVNWFDWTLTLLTCFGMSYIYTKRKPIGEWSFCDTNDFIALNSYFLIMTHVDEVFMINMLYMFLTTSWTQVFGYHLIIQKEQIFKYSCSQIHRKSRISFYLCSYK